MENTPCDLKCLPPVQKYVSSLQISVCFQLMSSGILKIVLFAELYFAYPLKFNIKIQCINSRWRGFPTARYMMTSSNGNIFRVTGPLCGGLHSQRPVTRSLMFSLICAWALGWSNNRESGNLRRHRTHYDVIVMLRINNASANIWTASHVTK